MAFSSEMKKELALVQPEKDCCTLAELTGFVRIKGTIMLAGGGRMGVVLSSDDPAVIRKLKRMITDRFEADTRIEVVQGSTLKKKKSYRLIFNDPAKGEQMLVETKLLMVTEEGKVLTDGIDQSILQKRCCRRACLRGLFMAAGSISDPKSGYHLEIVCSSEKTAADVRRLMNTFSLGAHTVKRKNSYVVYLKNSEHIVDFMNVTGAHRHLLDFENVRIKKSVRNETNRIMNCENANVDKQLDAAEKQLEDIRTILDNEGYEKLTRRLRDAVDLRIRYPELSLRELAEKADPPVTKSGLNHRYQKLALIAEEYRDNVSAEEKAAEQRVSYYEKD